MGNFRLRTFFTKEEAMANGVELTSESVGEFALGFYLPCYPLYSKQNQSGILFKFEPRTNKEIGNNGSGDNLYLYDTTSIFLNSRLESPLNIGNCYVSANGGTLEPAYHVSYTFTIPASDLFLWSASDKASLRLSLARAQNIGFENLNIDIENPPYIYFDPKIISKYYCKRNGYTYNDNLPNEITEYIITEINENRFPD